MRDNMYDAKRLVEHISNMMPEQYKALVREAESEFGRDMSPTRMNDVIDSYIGNYLLEHPEMLNLE